VCIAKDVLIEAARLQQVAGCGGKAIAGGRDVCYLLMGAISESGTRLASRPCAS
jgi:hypothetical protein